MAELRFEIWITPHSQECAAVSESWDRLRESDANFVEAFYASTTEEAMNHYYSRNGWSSYTPIPGVTDQVFTEAQHAEQAAYMAIRTHPLWT